MFYLIDFLLLFHIQLLIIFLTIFYLGCLVVKLGHDWLLWRPFDLRGLLQILNSRNFEAYLRDLLGSALRVVTLSLQLLFLSIIVLTHHVFKSV